MRLSACYIVTAFAAGSLASSVCTQDPPVLVSAGSTLSASIDDPWGKRCEAILSFADPSFLPVIWSFQPIPCPGAEIAEFTVPLGAPNGDGFVTWRCEGLGSLSCSHVVINNGTGNLTDTAVEQIGTVGCLLTTSTVATQTISGMVTIQTVASVLTSLSTSLAPASNGAANPTTTSTSSSGPAQTTSATGTTASTTPADASPTTLTIVPGGAATASSGSSPTLGAPPTTTTSWAAGQTTTVTPTTSNPVVVSSSTLLGASLFTTITITVVGACTQSSIA